MARKVKNYTVTADGRDKGKTFVITEMPARQSERWARRALMAMSRAGVDVPDNILDAGAAALIGFSTTALTRIDDATADALMDEMMACVQITPSAGIVRDLIDDDIDEPLTILRLRSEVIEVHVGFSIAGTLSTLVSAKRAQSPMNDTQTSSDP